MSKLAVKGHASGTGTVTLEAPNTSTDRTITLPDEDVTLGAATPSITDNGNATAITIDVNENVGIGVATPESVLEIERGSFGSPYGVNEGEFADSLITLGNSTSSNDLSQITFGYSGGTGDYGAAYFGYKNTSTAAQGYGDLVFGTRPSSSDSTQPTERLKITSDGRGLSQFTAKVWVHFNGTGTVAIEDSHNVSSITDGGTGTYTVNFSNNIANGGYCSVGSCERAGANGSFINMYNYHSSYIKFNTIKDGTGTFSSGDITDNPDVSILVFGD